MNILIITPFYKHDKNIASVRWTNLSARLAKKHNVIVVTQPQDDMDMQRTVQKDDDGILVARINQKTGYEKIAIKHFGGATGDDWQTASAADTQTSEGGGEGLVRKLKNRVMFASMKQKARSYAKEIQKNVIPKGMKIDVVISSACPFIEMLFGYEAKKRLGCKWISDFRDLPYKEDNNDTTHNMKKLMCKALKGADRVTVVANSMKEALQEDGIVSGEKVLLIRNGFSLSDKRQPLFQDDGKLHIVHTGSLYGGMMKSDLLFAAISELYKTVPESKVAVECAGGNNQSIIDTAAKYGLQDIVIDHGFIPRSQAIALQNEADCLLILMFNIRAGGFGAKVFEYMLCDKPIISVSSGKLKDGETTRFVRELNLGIAAEEATADEDIPKLADYLRLQWQRKIAGERLQYQPDYEKINQFDYDNLVNQVEEACKAII